MKFKEALEILEKGGKVYRKEWGSEKGSPEEFYIESSGSILMIHFKFKGDDCFHLKSFAINGEDLSADDWVEYKGE